MIDYENLCKLASLVSSFVVDSDVHVYSTHTWTNQDRHSNPLVARGISHYFVIPNISILKDIFDSWLGITLC